MKSVLVLISSLLLAGAVHGSSIEPRRTGYVQKHAGIASFSIKSDCSKPACGKTANGYTAAINQLTFGAPPGKGPGDACGRCFRLTGKNDPHTKKQVTKKEITVKVIDLCPVDEACCTQSNSHRLNEYGQSVHFELCKDSGAAKEFFPEDYELLTGRYKEVPCSEWHGTDGNSLQDNACLAGENCLFWPTEACKNQGTAPA